MQTSTMTYQALKQLNRQHYRVLRAAFKDRKCEMSKETLNRLAGRATPRQWAKYIVSSTTIKMMHKGTTPMSEKLRNRAYVNDRFPGKAMFANRSKTKIGRQSLPNRLDFLREIKLDWNNAEEPISKDKLRVALKIFFSSGQKVPGSKAGRPLIYCRPKVCSGQVRAHLYLNGNHSNRCLMSINFKMPNFTNNPFFV